METNFDIVIIGGGPGGYVAAIRAVQLGMHVGLVERESLGGVCLNWGCIPTKSLLRNAEVARLVTGGGKEYGFKADNVVLDYSAAVERSRKVSARLVKGVGALMKGNAITVVEGVGRLRSATEVEVTAADGSAQVLKGGAVILATGARARMIPGVEADGERVLTYREALDRRTLPKSAVVIGAGPIGLEFATVWSSYGADVRVVEMLDHLLPAEDEEAAGELGRYLRRQKVKAMVATRVQSVMLTDAGVRVHVAGPGGEEDLDAELALVAIGVRPNSEELGLERVGVATDRGWVTVDGRMQTNIPTIYAIGDLNGRMPLAHVASAQGILAVETIAGRDPAPFDSRWVPRGTYTSPQVASFGMSEAEAREKLPAVSVGRFPFLPNGKALALGENEGFVKIISDTTTHEIVGAVIVGPEATEILPELVLAAKSELTAEEIAATIHAHPTLNEAVMEAAHAVFGAAIHTVD
ncbi:MAG: dihydrolipoyl dehydrogenase [Anaerolineae bacterium]|jgi:dihydrolipoamide dehydrogenase|nr:dihydrolipoyl dehydrogenase [Anaerolineae bacterium]